MPHCRWGHTQGTPRYKVAQRDPSMRCTISHHGAHVIHGSSMPLDRLERLGAIPPAPNVNMPEGQGISLDFQCIHCRAHLLFTLPTPSPVYVAYLSPTQAPAPERFSNIGFRGSHLLDCRVTVTSWHRLDHGNVITCEYRRCIVRWWCGTGEIKYEDHLWAVHMHHVAADNPIETTKEPQTTTMCNPTGCTTPAVDMSVTVPVVWHRVYSPPIQWSHGLPPWHLFIPHRGTLGPAAQTPVKPLESMMITYLTSKASKLSR